MTVDASYSLDQLQNLSTSSAYYQQQVSTLNIRFKAVQEAAEALGMQAGLYDQSQKINQILDAHAVTLDKIFNFNLLVYQQHVLPPVIEHAGESLNVGPANTTLRIDGETYNVVRQVKFVTAPPTWRDYLWMPYKQPELPNKVLLPRNDQERKIWREFIHQGWTEGEIQGEVIFKINLKRLERDYNGMVLYKSLLLRGMVSPFYVSSKESGITGNDSHMVIDDRTMAITNFPALQLHSKLWNPVATNYAYQPESLPPSPPPPPKVIPAQEIQGLEATQGQPQTQTQSSVGIQNELLKHEMNIVVPAPVVTAKPVYSIETPVKSKGASAENLSKKSDRAPIVTAKPIDANADTNTSIGTRAGASIITHINEE